MLGIFFFFTETGLERLGKQVSFFLTEWCKHVCESYAKDVFFLGKAWTCRKQPFLNIFFTLSLVMGLHLSYSFGPCTRVEKVTMAGFLRRAVLPWL